jgi:FAD/FMN-containing dehydrogenase
VRADDTVTPDGLSARDLDRALKQALDPDGILSPGKQGIWPSSIR